MYYHVLTFYNCIKPSLIIYDTMFNSQYVILNYLLMKQN